jgi:hypothetical protein
MGHRIQFALIALKGAQRPTPGSFASDASVLDRRHLGREKNVDNDFPIRGKTTAGLP